MFYYLKDPIVSGGTLGAAIQLLFCSVGPRSTHEYVVLIQSTLKISYMLVYLFVCPSAFSLLVIIVT